MNVAFERTLVFVKPDGVRRRLVGRVISRLEEKGLYLAALKMVRVDRLTAAKHYAEHRGKPFYQSLVDFITSGPIVLMVVEGVGAVEVVRKLCGATFGGAAEAGTLRGDFSVSRRNNVVHASDSPASAAREIALYFRPEEILELAPDDLGLFYDLSGGKPE